MAQAFKDIESTSESDDPLGMTAGAASRSHGIIYWVLLSICSGNRDGPGFHNRKDTSGRDDPCQHKTGARQDVFPLLRVALLAIMLDHHVQVACGACPVAEVCRRDAGRDHRLCTDPSIDSCVACRFSST